MKKRILYSAILLLISLPLHAQSVNQAYKMVSKNPEKTFIGAILEYKSINENEYRSLNRGLKPIDITINVTGNKAVFKTIVPSYENMMNVLKEEVEKNNIIAQSGDFVAAIKELRFYNELYFLFGEYIDKESTFLLPKNAKLKKTTLVVDMSQSFFSITMNYPEDGKHSSDKEVVKKIDDLVYVNSVRFGRKAVVIVESDSPSNELKVAVKEAISKGGEAAMSDKSRAIINNATIRTMVIGGLSLPEKDADLPITKIMEYFQKPFYTDDFGQPITFTANYVKKNSIYKNAYVVEE